MDFKILLQILILDLNFPLILGVEQTFLKDFIEEKKVINFLSCWTKGKVSKFQKDNISKFLKMVTYQKNVPTKSLAKLFQLEPRFDYWFILNLINCGNFEIILKYMNDNHAFKYPSKHLLLIDEHSSFELLENIVPCDIFPMTDIVIAIQKNESWIDMYQPYKYEDKGKMVLEYYGNWSQNDKILYSYKTVPNTKRRRNFQKSEIIIGVALKNLENIEGVDFDDVPTSSISKEPFFFQDFPNTYNMVYFLNATYSLRHFESYGYLNHTTGEFDGLVRDVMNEKSHLSGTALIMSEDRQSAVEFLNTYNQYGIRLILKKPSMSYIENIYLMTFTGKVWLACGVFLSIFGGVLYILLNWEMKKDLQAATNYTVSDIILISLEAVCQQGTFIEPKTYSGRILILILFTAFMFLYVAYSAYILVLLQSTKPITSIRQLVDSRIECGGMNLSYIMSYYESTKDTSLMDLYKKKIIHNKQVPIHEGLKKVQQGNFALHIPLSAAYKYILKTYTNYDICKLQELPGYMTTDLYIIASKTSQHKKLFKIGLMRIHETGLQARTKHRISIKPKCYSEAGNFQSVRIYDCNSVFFLYVSGVALSLIIFLIEKLVAEYTKKKKNISLDVAAELDLDDNSFQFIE